MQSTNLAQKIRFGKSVIEYGLIRTGRRKTSQITVDKNGVIVRAPLSKSDKEISSIVRSKARWIYKKQLEFEDRKRIVPSTRKLVTEKYLYNRTMKLASKIGVKPSKIIIKKLKSRWGSATKNNVVTLNLALVTMPRKVIDYVIIHELCHLVIRNHSFRYWNLVRKYMYDYVKIVTWLQQNSTIESGKFD